MEQSNRTELSPDEIERFKLGYELSKESVQELGIPDASTYEWDPSQEPLASRFFKTESDRNVLLIAEVGTIYGNMEIRFSFTFIAHDLLWLIENLLSDEKAPTVLQPSVVYELKKRNISMLKLFDMDEDEIVDVKRDVTKRALAMFTQNIPLFTRSAVIDALGHTKIGYCQHLLKPLMSEHWNQLGLPDDFGLITEPQLDDIRKYNNDRKRWFLGDRRQLLNMATLADEAGDLRKTFKQAKVRYKEYKQSFYLLNPNASIEAWQGEWSTIHVREFPGLFYLPMTRIEHHPPFELVNMQLAEQYGYDPEVMRKKITQSRRTRTNPTS